MLPTPSHILLLRPVAMSSFLTLVAILVSGSVQAQFPYSYGPYTPGYPPNGGQSAPPAQGRPPTSVVQAMLDAHNAIRARMGVPRRWLVRSTRPSGARLGEPLGLTFWSAERKQHACTSPRRAAQWSCEVTANLISTSSSSGACRICQHAGAAFLSADLSTPFRDRLARRRAVQHDGCDLHGSATPVPAISCAPVQVQAPLFHLRSGPTFTSPRDDDAGTDVSLLHCEQHYVSCTSGYWAGEARGYDIRSNSCSGVCAHYTQIVWGTTLAVGCAVARSAPRGLDVQLRPAGKCHRVSALLSHRKPASHGNISLISAVIVA